MGARAWIGFSLASLLAFAAMAPLASAQVEAEFSDEFDTAYDEPPDPEIEAELAADVQVEADTERPPAGDSQAAAPSDSRQRQLFRAQNSWFGPVGGFHTVDASSGPPGTFRLQLGIDFFSDDDFLEEGDENDHVGGTLSLSWTVTEHIELFGSVANHANSNTMEEPVLLQVLGDTLLGAKAFAPVAPVFGFGGDLRFVVLNTVGDIGPVFEGTSFGLRGLASFDLRQLEEPVPLLGRLNLGYFFDNSSNLIEDVENARFDRLTDPAGERQNEDRHLVRRVERFALGINRTDFFEIGLGFEAPLQADEDFFIHPLLEWELRIPVNRQDYSCLAVPTGAGVGDPDGCLDIEGFSAMPQTLTLGARVLPPVRGLSFALGLDIGLSGVTTFVRELAANKPHDFLLAIAYTVDTEPPPATEQVEVVREVVKEPPPGPRVEGMVVEAGLGNPVPRAIISYPGTDRTDQATDEQGRFVSYELPPGEARFDVSHPDYEAKSCFVQIPQPGAAPAPSAPAAPASPAPPAPPGAGPSPAPPPAPAGELTLTPIPESPPPGPMAPGAPPAGPAGAPGPATGAPAPSGPLLVPLRCELTPLPRAGSLDGSVVDEAGQPVAGARIDLSGPTTQSLTSDGSGRFSLPELEAGAYTANVDSEGHFMKTDGFSVEPGRPATPRIVLTPRPERASVTLTKREVRIRKRIFFKTNSAEISERSHPLLREIADVLNRNPQVQQVEVQGHTDNRGSPEVNRQLSQQRAEAVMQWLVSAGVSSSRLSAKGYGDTRPIVPNLTDRNRARNRRVQFIIREQQSPE